MLVPLQPNSLTQNSFKTFFTQLNWSQSLAYVENHTTNSRYLNNVPAKSEPGQANKQSVEIKNQQSDKLARTGRSHREPFEYFIRAKQCPGKYAKLGHWPWARGSWRTVDELVLAINSHIEVLS